jgi:hypothetical protein
MQSLTFDLLSEVESETNANDKGYFVRQVNYQDTIDFILNIHYAKRVPSISYAYGLFEDSELVGVITYGKPPSPPLCDGVCGAEYSTIVIELNRLVLKNNKQNEGSYLISKSLKMLPKPSVVVSYADSEQNHVGYVYQATNWIYTGLSDKHTEWRKKNSDLHSKNICKQFTLKQRLNDDSFYVIDRPRKHRYVYFLGSKSERKNLRKQLKYPIQSYPKIQGEKHGV